MNEYLIKEETLDNIAIQSMNLMGKTEAVSTSTIISDLTSVNSEVNSQADLINLIASILEGKAGGSGNTDIEDALITRTFSIYTNNRVTNIGNYTFYCCTSLTSVSFPICSYIGSSAFQYCYKLTSVSFPECSYIGGGAFEGCSNLTSVSFPECSYIDYNAFHHCDRLTSVSFPVCTSIDYNAFAYCSTNLTSVNFPKCSYINDYAFGYCSSLISISFPVCKNIGDGAFYYCTNLTSVNFPVCSYIGGGAFAFCSNLTSVNLPVCSRINNYAFSRCYNLSSLILGTSTICTLSNSNAFSFTPYAGYSASFSGTPHIYVPLSLIDSYKTATNWTYFSSYFSAIVDTGGADNIG